MPANKKCYPSEEIKSVQKTKYRYYMDRSQFPQYIYQVIANVLPNFHRTFRFMGKWITLPEQQPADRRSQSDRQEKGI